MQNSHSLKYLAFQPPVCILDGANAAIKKNRELMKKQLKEYQKNLKPETQTRQCRGCYPNRFPISEMGYYETIISGRNRKIWHCSDCMKRKPEKNWVRYS